MDSRANDLSLLWHQRTTLKRGSKCKHTYLFRTTAWKVSKLIWSFHMFWLLPLPPLNSQLKKSELKSISDWKERKIKSNCDKISFSGKSERTRVFWTHFLLYWNNFSCIGTSGLKRNIVGSFHRKISPIIDQIRSGPREILCKRGEMVQKLYLYHNLQLFLCITIGKFFFFFVSQLESFSLYQNWQVFLCLCIPICKFLFVLYHN